MTAVAKHVAGAIDAGAFQENGLNNSQRVRAFDNFLRGRSESFGRILPTHIKPEHFRTNLLNSALANPSILECSRDSLMQAAYHAAALGIIIQPTLGLGYLVPFKDHKGVKHAQFIIGYRGLMDLAWRSDNVSSIQARVVRDGDKFDYRLGRNPDVDHKLGNERGAITHAWCVAEFTRGLHVEVMVWSEIEAIRDSSAGYKSAEYSAKKYNRTPKSPWHDHAEEMARKTVIRRAAKNWPMATELMRAVSYDEAVDRGASVRVSNDGDFDVVEPADELTAPDADGPNPAPQLEALAEPADAADSETGRAA